MDSLSRTVLEINDKLAADPSKYRHNLTEQIDFWMKEHEGKHANHHVHHSDGSLWIQLVSA